ncbi:MAG TPA: zinc-binding dehydrogenase [Acidimicrobiales bacterium]|nr:zinc-binding dehydrogenase [Acidimicrobiales bacterium]
MRALVFERKVARYAAAAVAGRFAPGRGAKVGPLRLATDLEEPDLPAGDWVRVRPRLAGICGSDLATIDGRSSRYFEPIVSFPFVPGHEIVGDLDDATRVVLQPTLTCAARGIAPPCDGCAQGATNRCQQTTFGHVAPGLQTGFCEDTGGGWGVSLVAHETQLHRVPDDLSDEAAVLVEPTACAVHAVSVVPDNVGVTAVIGAGTLGLLTLAALQDAGHEGMVVATAKHPEQRRWAEELGAHRVVEPAALERAVRSTTRSLQFGRQLTGGAAVVVDCVGSADSLAQSLRVVAPGGTIVMVGMPGVTTVDLTSLWHREVTLTGAYAYTADDFATAFALVRTAGLERLLTATYPLDRFTEAIEHAANAGARGAVKIAFDLRNERNR